MIGSVFEAQAQLADIEKACRKRQQPGQPGRDQPAEGPAPPAAHEAARAGLEAVRADAPAKAFSDRGIELGPGPSGILEPVQGVEPRDLRRPYLRDGHAAPSPAYEPTRENPMPGLPRGYPIQVRLPDAPLTGLVPQDVAVSWSSPSPSYRDR
jgi:hypothetical protein